MYAHTSSPGNGKPTIQDLTSLQSLRSSRYSAPLTFLSSLQPEPNKSGMPQISPANPNSAQNIGKIISCLFCWPVHPTGQ